MQDPEYIRAWTDYRKKTRIFFGMFIGWIPFGIFVSILFSFLRIPEVLAAFIFVPYMIGIAVASYRRMEFRCPRCKKRFFMTGPFPFAYGNPYASICLHCKLKKYAEYDTGEVVEESFLHQLLSLEKMFDRLSTPLLWTSAILGVTTFSNLILAKDSTGNFETLTFAALITSALSAVFSIQVVFSQKNISWPKILDEMPIWSKITLPITTAILTIAPAYYMFWSEGHLSFPPSKINFMDILRKFAPFQCLFAFTCLKIVQNVRRRAGELKREGP